MFDTTPAYAAWFLLLEKKWHQVGNTCNFLLSHTEFVQRLNWWGSGRNEPFASPHLSYLTSIVSLQPTLGGIVLDYKAQDTTIRQTDTPQLVVSICMAGSDWVWCGAWCVHCVAR